MATPGGPSLLPGYAVAMEMRAQDAAAGSSESVRLQLPVTGRRPTFRRPTEEPVSELGEKTTGFARSCLADYNSGINAAITYTAGNGKYLRINTNRCNNADNCNSGTLAVPTVDAAANGLQCPTCFALNSDPCDSQITPCTGDEKYCIDFAGTLTKGSTVSTFVAKGCATASTKDIQPGTSLVSAVYTFMFTKVSSQAAEKITPTTKPPAAATKPTTATTSGASPALGRFSFALYLPGLTGLLLVKLLA
ncbi:phospholipase A2 inhibitor and Ly6/PLAUR domain-containing protein-like [Mauremys mutica]|uniref:phospholipase A2 inhibitor and Ly6/PLAUR domain-containing protein-like n=1 Tax=Mauremys mutica TaxID=74926 RepID=UPI001D167720|nr:phospholipase A2 inhibitor and Ly6/PLAUR domain-containing protein-like [Mauremys mutica]